MSRNKGGLFIFQGEAERGDLKNVKPEAPFLEFGKQIILDAA